MSLAAKRARVMGRSRKLGHCICDPRKPCPCDTLRQHDVCLCAGERFPEALRPTQTVALTKLVSNAGCASKIPPADLARVLSRLPPVEDPRLLVGAGTADDAGVFQVSPDLCLVQTVDVFTPCVDDPYQFGQIAACNSLSDCYAMGGTPLTALSIIGYPIHTLSDQWMSDMLRGGMDKLAEAGVALAGGHSIDDGEIKFGFAVTGIVAPDEIVTNAGAQPGDVLILTKRIGTGIIAFAAQMGRASPDALLASADSMTRLNQAASEVMRKVGAHACTDVTGFGLLGHLVHLVRESAVTAEIWWDAVPLLPEVPDYAGQGLVSGAAERNREFAAEFVESQDGVPDWAMDTLHDAQTSGGLLISLPADRASRALSELRTAGCPEAAAVGRITAKSKGAIIVTSEHARTSISPAGQPDSGPVRQPSPCCAADSPPQPTQEECCAPGSAPVEAGAAQQAFSRFMAAAFGPGALDVIQKELMVIALSVAVQCEPCIQIHLEKAKQMGISNDEIQEAAWLGVAFGGAKAMMFWTETWKSLGTTDG
jgi:selenide,water dikinase